MSREFVTLCREFTALTVGAALESAGAGYSPHYPGLFHRLSTIFAGLFHSFVNAAGRLWRYHPIGFLPGAIDETIFTP
jgi:hypothetical protein